MQLILGLIWLVACGAFYLLWEKDHPRTGSLTYPMTTAAGVLALFNLVRWASGRAMRSGAQGNQPLTWKRPPTRRPGDHAEPDPTFQFTDAPVPEPKDDPPPPSAPR